MPVSGCVCLVYNYWMCHARVWMCLFSLQPLDVSCPCLDVFVKSTAIGCVMPVSGCVCL